MSIKNNISSLIVTKKWHNPKTKKAVERNEIVKKTIVKRDATVDPDSKSGIASPLTELSRIAETHAKYDDFNVWSVELDLTTQINFRDDNGDIVIFNLELPQEFQI